MFELELKLKLVTTTQGVWGRDFKKVILNSTQVNDVVEVRVELGNISL